MIIEEYKARVAEVNPDIEVLGEYIDYKYEVKVRCRICGEVWHPKAGRLLQKTGFRN